MKKPDAPAPPAIPAPAAPTFFSLSFDGALPALLRALADKLEARDCTAKAFHWNLTDEALEFTAQIDMGPK